MPTYTPYESEQIAVISLLADHVHEKNSKWWHDMGTGERLKRNVGEMLMLITSELAEALEGDRKDLMDEHLPHLKSFDVELADALIRLLDLAAGKQVDLGVAFVEKQRYNATRKDHTVEARLAAGGKKY